MRSSDSSRRIRNTARFLLANLADFDPARDSVPVEKMQDIDRWALASASTKFARCRKAYEDYEFHVVYHRMLELCTVDLSAIYLDIQKDTLYVEAPASEKRRSKKERFRSYSAATIRLPLAVWRVSHPFIESGVKR